MSAPSIPMSVLVEASNALAMVRAMDDNQPLSFTVWLKVMNAQTSLQAAIAAMQPVAVVGAES